MTKLFSAVCAVVFSLFMTGAAIAQQNVWIQIEAQPTLRAAEASVRAYASKLDAVNGFRMSGSWYAVALGPFSRADADAQMSNLKRAGRIPRDSFIAFSSQYRQQFWPVGANALNAAPITLPSAGDNGVTEVAVASPLPPADETKAEARASERGIDREGRMALQVAMQWEGFYKAGIDGDFGPGTRRAMADYQAAMGYQATGILTSKQRHELLANYQAVIDSLGFQVVRDESAGIEMVMPTAMVGFGRYEAPFVHYDSLNGSGVRLVLISQTGDQNTLFGLYDILQTLEIVPLEGERERREREFTLTGSDDQISSYTHARLVDGAVKGFTLIWPAGSNDSDDRRRDMAISQMKASFASIPGQALADTAGLDAADQNLDLLSGLEIRRADIARSGFFVDNAGTVLTTSEAVANCQRITINESYEASILGVNAELGLAVLKPEQALAPSIIAMLLTSQPRLQSDIAVAGYSFEGRLSAPTLTFGTLADLKGLGGEAHLTRLVLNVQDGDAGGPVLDTGGAVLGMLLARDDAGGQHLPVDVNFAVDATELAAFLAEHGITATATDAAASMHPVDMSAMAADMTVLVSCWN